MRARPKRRLLASTSLDFGRTCASSDADTERVVAQQTVAGVGGLPSLSQLRCLAGRNKPGRSEQKGRPARPAGSASVHSTDEELMCSRHTHGRAAPGVDCWSSPMPPTESSDPSVARPRFSQRPKQSPTPNRSKELEFELQVRSVPVVRSAAGPAALHVVPGRGAEQARFEGFGKSDHAGRECREEIDPEAGAIPVAEPPLHQGAIAFRPLVRR